MSDVAVTWAKAQTCLTAKGKPDRTAKQVLVHMASYADAAGEAWALVSVLALEMECEERTVERGRQALVKAGLLIKTDQRKIYNGKVIPIYRLPLELGHASTVRRLAAERKAWGDTGDTPRPDLGATRVTPQDAWGDTGDTPRGDTGDTQIGKETGKRGLTPSAGARACAKAVEIWSAKAPERVSPVRVERSWGAALDRSGLTEGELLGAVEACAARDPDFRRGKAMNLDRWLDEGRFLAWLAQAGGDGAAPVPTAVWRGPEDVARAVAAVMGPGPRASYFDPARWDGERRAIVTRTRFAADRLRDEAGRALKALNVRIEHEATRHG